MAVGRNGAVFELVIIALGDFREATINRGLAVIKMKQVIPA